MSWLFVVVDPFTENGGTDHSSYTYTILFVIKYAHVLHVSVERSSGAIDMGGLYQV